MTDLLREYAMQMVGLPYRWGGDDPIKGFDCSGLAQELLAALNMDPPGDQSAQALYDYFSRPGFNVEARVLGCGSLCFYGKDLKSITHVAIMLNETTIIEAGAGGSTTHTIDDAEKQNAYVRLRRFDRRKDLVAVVMPNYGRMAP